MGETTAATTRTEDGLDRRALWRAAAVSAALAAPAAALAQQPPISSETQRKEPPMSSGGLSKPRLARMREVMAGHVTSGRVPGLVTLIDRRGETHVEAIGSMAIGGAPMRRDTIFRVASISKLMSAAAAMVLVEEGRLRLDDPVDAFVPELADRRVLKSLESPLTDTVPAKRAITLRDLLTFRLGLGAIMVFPERYPIQKAMSELGVAPGPYLPTHLPDEQMKRYGSLPLVHQPGERWLYDTGSHILGVLIARASGKTLGAFMRERLFEPLGMKDTGFFVPPGQIDRLATSYWTAGQPAGPLAVFDEARGGRFASPPAFESASGGLVSTVDDCLAFGRMMLAKGRHGGGRILSRLSVELMTADQITPAQKAASDFFPDFWENRGWGFGMSIITRRDDLAGVPGRFGWDGGYGTSLYCDPKEGLVGVLMTQRLWDSPRPPPAQIDFWTQAYQAIDD